MPYVRGRGSELLDPGARKVYVDTYDELPADYARHMEIDTSGKAFEDDLVTTGLGVVAAKPEGEDMAMDRPVFRGKVRYIHTGYGLGYEITDESFEDELYGVLNNASSRDLARSTREAESITAWNTYNAGFSTILVYDGLSLYNAAHLGIGDLTFSNVGAVDLSTAALKAATEGAMKLQNDRGLRIKIAYSDLITHPDGWWAAQEILGTQFILGAASGGETDSIISDSNVVNVVSQMGLMPFQSPYLTDVDAWFLNAPRQGNPGIKFNWRRTPKPVNGDDDRSGTAWWGISARWSTGATGWRIHYGSPGA